MFKKKIFKLLRTLDQEEFAGFEKYLKGHSAQQKMVLATFNYLKRFYPDFNDKKRLELAYAFKKIFKEPIEKKDYNRKKLLNLLSDINLRLKEYLMLQKINNSSLEGHLLWAKILMERGLDNEFSRMIKVIQSDINLHSKKSLLDYIQGLRVNYLYYYRAVQKKLEPQINAIQLAVENLDKFYSILHLKLACELKAREKILNIKTIETYKNPQLKLLPKIFWATNPLLSMYQQAFQLLNTNNENYYNSLALMLQKNKNRISTEEQHILLSYLQNYASAQIRNGKAIFWIKAHELNKFGVEQNLFAQKGLISHTQFNNIINAACKAKEFEWALGFVDQYKCFLDDSIRQSTTALSEAIIFYEMKEFDQILPVLLTIDFVDTHHAIRAKSLTLISYVELNWDKETIMNFCKSFLSFLKRDKKLRKETITATSNFVKITRSLIQDQRQKDVLIEKIKNTKPLYFDLWLLKKADEIK